MKAFISLVVVLPLLVVVWGYMPFEARHAVRQFVKQNWLRVLVPIAVVCAAVVGVSTTSFKLF